MAGHVINPATKFEDPTLLKKFSVQNSKIGGTRAASTFGDSIHHFKVEVTNSNMPPLLDYQTSTLAF